MQIGTANYVQPTLTLEVIEGIQRYLVDHGIDSLEAIRGVVQ